MQERWRQDSQRGSALDASKAASLADAAVSQERAADRAISRTRSISDPCPDPAWSVTEPEWGLRLEGEGGWPFMRQGSVIMMMGGITQPLARRWPGTVAT